MACKQAVEIIHHGAVNGVTGSCHQLVINEKSSLLIDCGLFQGAETAGSSNAEQLKIAFDIGSITALLVTHCHIDHVGRIPYLLAAGFDQPIFATTATAALLPMVIEDAIRVGVTKDKRLIKLYLKKLKELLVPIEYNHWFSLEVNRTKSDKTADKTNTQGFSKAKAKFKPAGHILGSAYIEIELSSPKTDKQNPKTVNKHRVVFSGDLGATYTPLLASPKSPYRADTLIIESTYGDRNHQGRKTRTQSLRKVIEKAVSDNGVVLIPAFSIGRTQELLYELEQIIYQQRKLSANRSGDKYPDTAIKQEHKQGSNNLAGQQKNSEMWQSQMWNSIEIIVDSPLAANFTEKYIEFKELWDKEARRKLKQHRHPLDFDQLYTVDSHDEHLSTVEYLSKRGKPAIVIAASGMCSGGRIMNYLQQFIDEPTADILFVGYQARGTPGRDIQTYGPKGGYVYLEGDKREIKAGVHTISGYSAHADQNNLINFVKRMHHKPEHIRIVHGDDEAKEALAVEYKKLLPDTKIEIGRD
ncbi:beta-lactamase domain protein [Shewanella sediminis HAW-EB3]|uniref:Beta-lactamase domain protein n=1 Tax=Shewanella sediminis (strain HAW-EB3) TaxID=425104 RepID=A8FXJ6_SHESH|nr:MBL fold metallo-hydrolase [Shewanella sediminis]ABV37569.1 beta-lactamase domain protein [Shewanella sediminis HAW-EB3]